MVLLFLETITMIKILTINVLPISFFISNPMSSLKMCPFSGHKHFMPYLHESVYFSFVDLPYEQARRSAWTSHTHPSPQSKGKKHLHMSTLWA